MSEQAKWAVGVDGGGTKSTACLISSEGTLLGRMEFCATNYSKEAEWEIVSEIQKAARQLWRQTDRPEHKPDVLAVCLSGLGRDDVRDRIKQVFIEKDIADHIFAESDAAAALHGAFAGREGIIINAGTGSIVLGKSQAGETIRCGGWGYLLGDEGSGFDIGRNGIAAALKAYDGRGPATSLGKRFEEFFEVGSIQQIVTAIYAGYNSRGALAQFAPIVFEEAAKGDSVARDILDTASMELVQLVVAVAKKCKTKGRIPVALMGNIFQNKQIVAGLKKHWRNRHGKLQLVEPLFPADVGAALLGLESIGVNLEQDHEKNLADSIFSRPHSIRDVY